MWKIFHIAKIQTERELNQLENSSKKMSRSEKATQKATSKRKNRILIICSIVLACCLVLGIGGFFLYNYYFSNRTISANISIAGVAVQGMTREEAAEAIEEAFLLSHRGKQMVVKLGDETITLTADVTNVHLDTDALTKAAAQIADQYPQQEIFPFADYVQMDKDAVMPILQAATDKLQSTLVQTSYVVAGQAPENYAQIDETAQQKITFTIGMPGISINPELVYEAILLAYADGNFSFEYTFPIEHPEPLDLTALFAELCVAPIDAITNPETFEVIPEAFGFGFDLDAVAQALESSEPGQVLEFDYIWLNPTVTKEALTNAMFVDVLGDMSTTAGWSASRNTNLRIACEAINGIIVMPGETFSFNKYVGATTKDKGYDVGHGYMDGEVAEVIGGGICQVASTLYVACVEADLKIVERYMHAYMPSYMGASTDATVYYPYLDYKFKNDTDRPIKIEAVASGAKVTCKILGVDTRDYYIKFETVIVKHIKSETIYKEYAPDNAEGYVDGQVLSKSSPYDSVESKSYRNKYDKETNKLISSKLENHETYDKRDKVVVKIVDPNPPITPDDTTAPSPEDTPAHSPENTPADTPDMTPTPDTTPAPDTTPTPEPENTPDDTAESTTPAPEPSPDDTDPPVPEGTPDGGSGDSGGITEDGN